jgi:hypothetical protein
MFLTPFSYKNSIMSLFSRKRKNKKETKRAEKQKRPTIENLHCFRERERADAVSVMNWTCGGGFYFPT